jgi:exopolysaccharide production protein ExoZ
MAQERYYSLDYLRGIAALGIMYFHLSSWTFGSYNAEDFWGRVGLYGVAVFYILSGLTLFLIYSEGLKPDWRNLLTFFIKRTFRIFPLLWLVVGFTLYLNPRFLETKTVFLSVSGLFGFLKPAGGIGTGVWSIGNIFVFYAVFPVLILLLQVNRWLFLTLSAALILTSLYFAFFLLNGSKPLAPQWGIYVNPLNQMVLFVGSMVFGYFAKNYSQVNQQRIILTAVLLFGACLAFTFYPASGDRITLVFGWNRLFFLALSFTICGSVFFLNFRLPSVLHKPLTITAEISFGLYLIHPILYFFLRDKHPELIEEVEPAVLVCIIAALTYLCSYIIYRFIEIPGANIGRFFTDKLKLPATSKKGQ